MAYATLVQLKRYLDIADYDTFGTAAVDTGNNNITLPSVGFVDDKLRTGTEVEFTSNQTPADLPAPLAESTIYYIILDTDQAIQVATSSANADAGTAISFTDTGTGTHTILLVDNDNTILESCLTRAEKAIETYTNRNFEAASATKYYGWNAIDGLWLWLDDDLNSLTSITNGDSSGTSIATSDVTKWPRNEGPPYHRIRLDDASSSSWEVDTDYWIQIEGDWGYSSTAPDDIVQATIRLAGYLYRQSDTFRDDVAVAGEGVVSIPRGMPESVKVLLDPYRRFSL